jgi:hypothetical protein
MVDHSTLLTFSARGSKQEPPLSATQFVRRRAKLARVQISMRAARFFEAVGAYILLPSMLDDCGCRKRDAGFRRDNSQRQAV